MDFNRHRDIEKMSRIIYNIRDILQEVVFLDSGYMKQIRERILSAEDGNIATRS